MKKNDEIVLKKSNNITAMLLLHFNIAVLFSNVNQYDIEELDILLKTMLIVMLLLFALISVLLMANKMLLVELEHFLTY